MDPAVRILWLVVPPAIYFLALGRRRSGRYARVVKGAIDATWLVFGFGAFVVFGPIGRALWSGVSSDGSRATIAIAGVLLTAVWIERGRRRLVVYNVAFETFEQALREAIAESPGTLVKTVRGYEDSAGGVALSVDISRSSRTAEISAIGPNCEGRLADLDPRLRRALARRPGEKARFAWNELMIANAILAAPVVLVLLTQPRAQADLGRWIARVFHSVVVKSPAAGRSGR